MKHKFIQYNRIIIALVAISLLIGGYLAILQLTGNFHSVKDGLVYRSAQPSGKDLDSYTSDLGLRSVINLRGASSSTWYAEEVEAANRNKLQLINFPMSDRRVLSSSDVNRLVRLMQEAPKPMLIHCKAGADRSGLAAALYLARVLNVPSEEAETQLSFRFGHIGIPFLSAAYAMDITWREQESLRIYNDLPYQNTPLQVKPGT